MKQSKHSKFALIKIFVGIGVILLIALFLMLFVNPMLFVYSFLCTLIACAAIISAGFWNISEAYDIRIDMVDFYFDKYLKSIGYENQYNQDKAIKFEDMFWEYDAVCDHWWMHRKDMLKMTDHPELVQKAVESIEEWEKKEFEKAKELDRAKIGREFREAYNSLNTPFNPKTATLQDCIEQIERNNQKLREGNQKLKEIIDGFRKG
jgi:hypothetical protein